MDVWIETIPFNETRNYVQNVLAFEVVYRELEQRSAPVLRGSEWVTPSRLRTQGTAALTAARRYGL